MDYPANRLYRCTSHCRALEWTPSVIRIECSAHSNLIARHSIQSSGWINGSIILFEIIIGLLVDEISKRDRTTADFLEKREFQVKRLRKIYQIYTTIV